MARRSERKILLLCMLFAFACLLLSGGWRLVSTAQEDDPLPVRPYASIRAALSSVPVQRAENVSALRRDASRQQMHAVPAPQDQELNDRVPSDANGNVLLGRTYMRAVYQAFVLDDGFV